MSLAPALLLSMPQMIDPHFARSVVLLCEHAAEGAFGLIVNRPSDITAAAAVRMEPPVDEPNDLPLLLGGPVEPERGWILTATPPEDVESRGVGAGLHLSASPLLLRRVLTARPLPRRTVVLAGYAGWGPGQLDAELEQSAWLIMPVELDLIFEIPAAASWEMAIRRLGADPHLLQMGHGVH
ncbi:MAG TPA: YqgE/AlgH family protein [Vicinamibacterales bacterium]|jgi:putative transcriptional regulator|nr:YqgE/AlgH family protein [Vicinamibacterales bacterium]